MLKPYWSLLAWFTALVAGSLSLPVIALAGKLGGGLLALSLFAGLALSGFATVAYSIFFAIYTRAAPARALLLIALGFTVLPAFFLVEPLAELSWQTIYGPRNVPIWPYEWP